MGEIINTKVAQDGKIELTLTLDYEEALQLKGRINNIRLFSEDTAEIKTNIAARGKNEATKYFLIPKKFRKDFDFPKEVICQRIDSKTKTIFVYVIDKLRI